MSLVPSDPQAQSSEPLTFSVIGDTPYSDSEVADFQQHMLDHNLFSISDFLIHVGDLKSGSDACTEQRYQVMADSLHLLAVPGFILVGDNEWVDCSDPDQGFAWWEEHLLGIEADFCGTPPVDAQPSRPENFGFAEKGVLFIGLNVATTSSSSLIRDDADWVDEQFASKGAMARAAVILSHKAPAHELLDAVAANAAAFGRPVLYIHGHGHSYEEEPGAFGEPNILRIQVPRGTASNPPIHVTVDADGDFALDLDPWPGGTEPFNRAPCVDAGDDFSVSLGETPRLDGQAADDGVGGGLTVAWSKRSGPGAVSFSDPAAEAPTVGFSAPGTYVLELSADDGVLATSDSVQVTVTGTGGAPALSVDDVVVAEGGSAVFTVTLQGSDGSAVSVEYGTTDDTALAGQDYGATSGLLSFSGSTIQRQVPVSVTQDSTPEVDETFFLDLWNASGAVIGKARGSAVIVDDDGGGSGGDGAVFLDAQSGGSTSSTVVATAAPVTAVAGNLYVAAVASKARRAVTSVSGLGLGWTRVRTQCSGRSQTGVEIWVGQGQPTGDGVVTATLESAPSNAVIAVSRYAGADLADPIGSVVSGNTLGTSGACSGGVDSRAYAFDLTTTVPGSLAFVAAAMRSKDHQPGSGYSERFEVYQGSGGGDTAGTSVADRVVSSAGSVSVDGAFSGDVDWAVAALEIRPAATTAVFFDVLVEPGTGGSVTLDPPGGSYAEGTVVTLTAVPDAGFTFSAWGGDLSGTANPEALVVDGDKNVTASFSPAIQYTLSVAPSAGGSVTLDPPGGSYAEGTVVTLTAVPDAGSQFSGWGGDLSGTVNPTTLVMDGDKSVTAAFTRIATLTVRTQGKGSVTLEPPGELVPGTSDVFVYPLGTAVTVTAVAESGFAFTEWTGDLSGSANPTLVELDADLLVRARFRRTR